ncbi:hypothetical protein NCAS_0A04390 [Naumovozyma castellii]|uniref:SRP9 domain-containing protein n=1 Tax=Naumovozyma castellii TaxID=27288 RepID=G0V6A5_NAUCA|nr:hypothetical protein NCAS_0A04390 [Naumovozyma castellii CBS 4309]CCC66997.1 hypothetical protein NCAS_0A04390 [Naumovozyma castellii CBS 4309]
MSVKPIDTFITSSVKLFEVNPSQTVISLTYKTPTEKKRQSDVIFKTHNPHLGTSYKFSTNKSKDVSRLLNAVGPRGVSVIPGRIERLNQTAAKVSKKKTSIKKKTIKDVVGLGSLIVNTDVKEYVPIQPGSAGSNISQVSVEGSKKRKNKNKNKKKR